MNYETAKRLKDAGFPQEDKEGLDEPYCSGCGYYQDTGKKWIPNSDAISANLDGEWKIEDWVHVPQLEELIESCGEGVIVLKRHSQGWDSGINKTGKVKDGILVSNYKTPSIAVALLWLTLNAKSDTTSGDTSSN